MDLVILETIKKRSPKSERVYEYTNVTPAENDTFTLNEEHATYVQLEHPTRSGRLFGNIKLITPTGTVIKEIKPKYSDSVRLNRLDFDAPVPINKISFGLTKDDLTYMVVINHLGQKSKYLLVDDMSCLSFLGKYWARIDDLVPFRLRDEVKFRLDYDVPFTPTLPDIGSTININHRDSDEVIGVISVTEDTTWSICEFVSFNHYEKEIFKIDEVTAIHGRFYQMFD